MAYATTLAQARGEFPSMPQHRKTNSVVAPIAAGLLILSLFGIYMASYYAALGHGFLVALKQPVLPNDPVPYELQPQYRVPGVAGLFWPAHQIDRRLRPAHWSTQNAFPF